LDITATPAINFQANNYVSGQSWVNNGSLGVSYNATKYGSPTLNGNGPLTIIFEYVHLTTTTMYQSYTAFRLTMPTDLNSNFTYCAWINSTNIGNGTLHYQLAYIISNLTSGNANEFAFGVNSAGKLQYGDCTTAAGSLKSVISTQSVNTGKWLNVAVTRQFTTGSIVLYINGIQDTTGTCNTNTINATAYLLIASGSDTDGYTFGGNISSILGYGRVLTANEILNNFNAERYIYNV
jgi:hypothetical protein